MNELAVAEDFLRQAGRGTQRQTARVIARAPWPVLRKAALTHPDPSTRGWLLHYLDHYDNDASMATFAEALHDPEERVRLVALHSIACESCKEEDLCVVDVVPDLIEVLQTDPSVDIRVRALTQLIYLSPRDERIRPAIERTAADDPDAILRKTAADAVTGFLTRPRKRYERSQLRHASTRPRR